MLLRAEFDTIGSSCHTILGCTCELRGDARMRFLSPGSVIRLPAVILSQIASELRARYIRRLTFRSGENASDADAYFAFSADDLDRLSRWQSWTNWRTIPRVIRAHLPATSIRTIDLCAGHGGSAEVLAACLSPDSEILGLEYNSSFVEFARKRTSRLQQSRRIKIQFRAQSVLETFCDVEGRAIISESIDFVNCCGAVGVHFAPAEAAILADEIQRVLRPGGLASIDFRTHRDIHRDARCYLFRPGV